MSDSKLRIALSFGHQATDASVAFPMQSGGPTHQGRQGLKAGLKFALTLISWVFELFRALLRCCRTYAHLQRTVVRFGSCQLKGCERLF